MFTSHEHFVDLIESFSLIKIGGFIIQKYVLSFLIFSVIRKYLLCNSLIKFVFGFVFTLSNTCTSIGQVYIVI